MVLVILDARVMSHLLIHLIFFETWMHGSVFRGRKGQEERFCSDWGGMTQNGLNGAPHRQGCKFPVYITMKVGGGHGEWTKKKARRGGGPYGSYICY